jgi:myo-inositol-1(or 4)-monophosphatase
MRRIWQSAASEGGKSDDWPSAADLAIRRELSMDEQRMGESDPTMKLTQLLNVAIFAAREAGDLIMTYYESAYEAWDKSPHNPVTTADLAADHLLHRRLMTATPDYGWLSEETRDTPERLGKRFVWVVDPLDGTREFIDGRDEFTVSVALAEEGQAVLGVIHNPATGETVSGIAGRGLTYNGEAIHFLSQRTEVRGAHVLISDTEFRRRMWVRYEGILNLEQMGSTAYKLARVVANLGDAYVSMKPKHEWDICAGVALVMAASGQATDLDGQPFRFNQENVEVKGVVVANPTLHAGLMELLRGATA